LLDTLRRLVRDNDKPFGGLQVIACGDFAPLPPVRLDTAQDDASRYLFNHAVWKTVMRETLLLTVMHRQREPELLEMLESEREGRLTPL
jgi:ATP-dependent DNA helicase PIF1